MGTSSKTSDTVSHDILTGKAGQLVRPDWELPEWQGLEGFESLAQSSSTQRLILGPVLFKLLINNLDEGIEFIISKSAANTKFRGVVLLPFRRSHTLKEWARAESFETQQGQVQVPILGKEEPSAPLQDGGQPAGKQVC